MLPATPAASLLEAIGDSLRYKFLLSQRLKTPSLPSLPAHIGSHKVRHGFSYDSLIWIIVLSLLLFQMMACACFLAPRMALSRLGIHF